MTLEQAASSPFGGRLVLERSDLITEKKIEVGSFRNVQGVKGCGVYVVSKTFFIICISKSFVTSLQIS